MNLRASDAFLVNSPFSQVHTKLKAIKKALLAKEDAEFTLKSASSLAFYLDIASYQKKPPSLKETQKWLQGLDADTAEKEITDVQAWVYPLDEDNFLVKFFNLRPEHLKSVSQKLGGEDFSFISGKNKPLHLSAEEWKLREKVWLGVMGHNPSWKKVGFLFNLYEPSPLTLESLFKKMPTLKERQKRLAEELVGDNWLSKYPEDDWPNHIFSMVEHLKGPEGQAQIQAKIKEIKKIKLITKIKDLL